MNRSKDSEQNYSFMVKWIEEETGLCFPDVHYKSIMAFAEKRSKSLGIDTEEYLKMLKVNREEKNHFLDSSMIGETYFFRDEKQFSVLLKHVLPSLHAKGQTVSLWSASTASGEEAISLMALLEEFKNQVNDNFDYKILASDINSTALSNLEKGIYPMSSFRNDGKLWHHLLEPFGSFSDNAWEIRDHLDKIHTSQINLLKGPFPENESQDIVFLRNTLLYMKQNNKTRILENIIKTIKPNGFLFVASPEVPAIEHPDISVSEYGESFFFVKCKKPKAKTVYPAKPIARPKLVAKTSSLFTRKHASSNELDSAILLVTRKLKAEKPDLSSFSQREVKFSEIIYTTMNLMESNLFSRAVKKIEEFEKLASENWISLHLKALASKLDGQTARAVELWEKSRIYNEGFWLSSFQAGQLLLDSDTERAKFLLRECIELIDRQEKQLVFSALLEGFDPAYYRRMAVNMLQKAEKSEVEKNGIVKRKISAPFS